MSHDDETLLGLVLYLALLILLCWLLGHAIVLL